MKDSFQGYHVRHSLSLELFLGPKSFLIHSTTSGKVFPLLLCKGTIAQRRKVTSPESHSWQESWAWDSNPALSGSEAQASHLQAALPLQRGWLCSSRTEPNETSEHVD